MPCQAQNTCSSSTFSPYGCYRHILTPVLCQHSARAGANAGPGWQAGAKSAEDIFRKALAKRSSFIAELTGSGAVSAADLAHTLSLAFAVPLIDLDAVDPQLLPKGLLDLKICFDFRLVVLGKRQNRLIVATADPQTSNQRRRSSFLPR